MTIRIDRVDDEGTQAENGFTLEEWTNAVNTIKGVRLAGKTDENALSSEHDAELYNSYTREWCRLYYWDGDQAWFPFSDPGDKSFPILKKAFEIADALDAVLINDDGEVVKKEDFSIVFDE